MCAMVEAIRPRSLVPLILVVLVMPMSSVITIEPISMIMPTTLLIMVVHPGIRVVILLVIVMVMMVADTHLEILGSEGR